MNISFICKSDRPSERHMLEHLMFYRTLKYPEVAEFYQYMNSNGVGLNFYSSYDYTEITFYNVTKNLEKEIDEAFKTFFFTKEDFELEKRVILIECDSYDYDLVETEMNLLSFKYGNLCDRNIFENMSYENILQIKKDFVFEKVIFTDTITDAVIRNFDSLEKLEEKFINNLMSFSFKKNPLVYELSEILYKCFFVSSFEDNLNLSRVFTLKESTVIIHGIRNREALSNVLNSCIDKNFEQAYKLFIEEKSHNGVSYELLGNLNIKNLFSKDEVRSMLKNFVKEICK